MNRVLVDTLGDNKYYIVRTRIMIMIMLVLTVVEVSGLFHQLGHRLSCSNKEIPKYSGLNQIVVSFFSCNHPEANICVTKGMTLSICSSRDWVAGLAQSSLICRITFNLESFFGFANWQVKEITVSRAEHFLYFHQS